MTNKDLDLEKLSSSWVSEWVSECGLQLEPKTTLNKETKSQLETQLWNIADTLRWKMDADEFKDYILWFIFYKYLSDKFVTKANNELSIENLKYEDLDETKPEDLEIIEAIIASFQPDLGYTLRPKELFSYITQKWNSKSEKEGDNFIISDLQRVLQNIQTSTMWSDSEDDFDDLFSDIDLTSQKLGKTEAQKNDLVSKVLSHLEKIDFHLEDTKVDVLWDAYEYLIAQFASWAWKKAWEFYTPQEVSKILAKIVIGNKKQIKSVYDPTCGSGSLLLRVSKEVEDVKKLKFFGQELNRTTYNLARMNMIMHNVSYNNFDIKQDDTLENPLHLDERFEAIVANPPFSVKWDSSPSKLQDERFSKYGKLAPQWAGDYAFIQHMIHHLDDNWVMAVVLPHWVLFRWGAEGVIRQYIIEKQNYLDAVIWLPAWIFYWTWIATCIMVFRKDRKADQDVLFIDASNHYWKKKSQFFLRDEDIAKVADTYKNRIDEDKYSRKIPMTEIIENEYNLNISRYIDTSEPEEEIDLSVVSSEIKELVKQEKELDREIVKYCDELWIDWPFKSI